MNVLVYRCGAGSWRCRGSFQDKLVLVCLVREEDSLDCEMLGVWGNFVLGMGLVVQGGAASSDMVRREIDGRVK